MKSLLNTCTFLILSIFCNAQCKSELKLYTSGFDHINHNSFSFLNDALKDVMIVGYGENTHGAKEFTYLAQELMIYLNSNHNFNLLILETGFGEGAYLNDYIQGKRDNLRVILEEHNSTWRYKTKSFYKLMNWLRDYNKKSKDPIYVYGCEMQYVISDVNRVRNYLKKVKSNFIIEGFKKHLWQNITEKEKFQYYNTYSNLKKHFIDNQKKFIEKTSESDFNQIFHHIEVLGQFVLTINQNVEQRKHDFRDIYMSENIQWILNFHENHSKALYWAHNAHVGDWISNGIVDVTGHQLRKVYKKSYFNIATSFGTGSFKAFSKDWKMKSYNFKTIKKNSFTFCLKTFGAPNAFFKP